MPQAEMAIFTRSFDLIVWLLPITNNFPRAHRHTVTRRLLDAVLDLRERLEEANLRQHGAPLASLRGWINHVRFANTVGLRTAALRGTGLLP